MSAGAIRKAIEVLSQQPGIECNETGRVFYLDPPSPDTTEYLITSAARLGKLAWIEQGLTTYQVEPDGKIRATDVTTIMQIHPGSDPDTEHVNVRMGVGITTPPGEHEGGTHREVVFDIAADGQVQVRTTRGKMDLQLPIQAGDALVVDNLRMIIPPLPEMATRLGEGRLGVDIISR